MRAARSTVPTANTAYLDRLMAPWQGSECPRTTIQHLRRLARLPATLALRCTHRITDDAGHVLAQGSKAVLDPVEPSVGPLKPSVDPVEPLLRSCLEFEQVLVNALDLSQQESEPSTSLTRRLRSRISALTLLAIGDQYRLHFIASGAACSTHERSDMWGHGGAFLDVALLAHPGLRYHLIERGREVAVEGGNPVAPVIAVRRLGPSITVGVDVGDVAE